MIDLALDKDTHDVLYQGNDIPLAKDLDQVEQNLKERLLLYLKEWFLDTASGIPYYDDVLVKNPNIPNIENIIKAQITDTPDVIELVEFQGDYNSSARTYAVTFKARTEYGLAEVSTSIF